MNRLQEAIRRVVASVPGGGPRATDLGRALDLDSALAWQIHSLAEQPAPQWGARVVPRSGSMERFLRAAERRASQDLAHTARAAYEDFERVVEEVAGDRDTFDAMLSFQRPEDEAGLRRLRRAAYRADAAAWGVACRCKAHCAVFRTRPTGEFDSLSILGYVGLQRLHAGAMVSTLASTRTWGKESTAPTGDAAHGEKYCEVIREACSQPVPQFEHGPAPDGSTGEYLVMDGLGKRSESTVFWRNVAMAVPGVSADPPHHLLSTCRVPTELLLMDLLVPRGWVDPGSVRAWITPDSGYVVSDPNTRHRLPFEGAGQYVGTSLASMHSSHAPQYADIIRAEIERMGWGDTEFDVFRCEVEYPLFHSTAHLSIE